MKYSWFASYTVDGICTFSTAETHTQATHREFMNKIKNDYKGCEIVFTCVNCVPVKELLH